MTLSFPKDDNVFKLFSCSKCERTLDDGSKRMNGVVMDGSAVGILGKLPKFQRIDFQMNVIPRIADRQYIMGVSKSRRFIDAIMISEKNADCAGYFNVSLHG